jgi:hypothetical protein
VSRISVVLVYPNSTGLNALVLEIVREHLYSKLLHLNQMVSFAISMASSVELKVVKAGPKISSWKTRILLFLSKWLVVISVAVSPS